MTPVFLKIAWILSQPRLQKTSTFFPEQAVVNECRELRSQIALARFVDSFQVSDFKKKKWDDVRT